MFRQKKNLRKTSANIKKRAGEQVHEPTFQFSVSEIANEYNKHKKKSKTEKFITGGIIAAFSAIVISLTVYFRPTAPKELAIMAQKACSHIRVAIWGSLTDQAHTAEQNLLEEVKETLLASEPAEAVPYIDHTTELGEISRFSGEPVYMPPEDSVFSCILDTTLGPMLYYNQGDARWKDYLYGGADPIGRYGCGPACVAMVINSFSSISVTPVEMADWSAANGCYAPQSGSYHSLIPKSISAYGLQVDSVTERTAENAAELLRTGHILVALMGKGSLTQNGHFIIIAQLCDNGNVYIADPANYENCTKQWDLQQLMNELKRSYDSGGPLWAVSYGS